MLLFYLAQCFFCRTFQLKLHHVDVAVGLHRQVDAPFRGVVFRTGIEAQELEDDKEHVLIVQFQVAHQLVGRVGKEALQALHEGVDVARLHIPHKKADLEDALRLAHLGIIREQEADKTLFNFLIGESQTIKSETFIVTFNSKITALVK